MRPHEVADTHPAQRHRMLTPPACGVAGCPTCCPTAARPTARPETQPFSRMPDLPDLSLDRETSSFSVKAGDWGSTAPASFCLSPAELVGQVGQVGQS